MSSRRVALVALSVLCVTVSQACAPMYPTTGNVQHFAALKATDKDIREQVRIGSTRISDVEAELTSIKLQEELSSNSIGQLRDVTQGVSSMQSVVQTHEQTITVNSRRIDDTTSKTNTTASMVVSIRNNVIQTTSDVTDLRHAASQMTADFRNWKRQVNLEYRRIDDRLDDARERLKDDTDAAKRKVRDIMRKLETEQIRLEDATRDQGRAVQRLDTTVQNHPLYIVLLALLTVGVRIWPASAKQRTD